MKRRPGILAAALVLQHVPDLVRYGSKPAREAERFAEVNGLCSALTARPWTIRPTRCSSATFGRRSSGRRRVRGGAQPGEATRWDPSARSSTQRRFYELMAEVDLFDLVRLGEESRRGQGRPAHLYRR